MYDIYCKFYDDNRKEVNQLYIDFFKKGSESLNEFRPHSASKSNKEKEYKTITNALSFRGCNENIFVMARTAKNEWCDSILINKNHICEEEKYSDTSEKRDIVRGYSTYNKYEFKAYGLIDNQKNSFNFDNLSRMAFRSDRPMPLTKNYLYDKRLGLYRIDNNESDED